MMKIAFATLVLAAITVPAFAGVAVTEGFEDVSSLAARGWLNISQSEPPGETPGWFQGSVAQFDAHSGEPDSYAAANYNNAAPGGAIRSWLLTPLFDATYGADVSFYLRSAGATDGYKDQLAYGFSDLAGASALTVVSPVPDSGWTHYTAHIDPHQLGTTRFAFEYFGPADTSNYIGLDTVTVNVPEPASIALLCGGLLGLGAIRRRARA